MEGRKEGRGQEGKKEARNKRMKGGKTAEGRAKGGIEGTREAYFGYMGLTSGTLEALRGDFEVT